MARNENPPFGRGETFYNGETINANDLGGENLLGMEWVFEDVHPTTGAVRTENPVRCRIVRNTSGITLLPSYRAQFSTTAGEFGSRITGYAAGSSANDGYPIDEYLDPVTGVPDDDLCWVVIEGPAMCRTSIAAAGEANIAVGGWAVGATAAGSTATTTAGRVEAQVLTGATALLANQVQNRLGRALTARTTANTDVLTLFYIGKW